jgi:hypothetical protein
VKKGRHRRFVEARELKRSTTTTVQPCPECGAEPEDVHADWCLFEEDRYEQILGGVVSPGDEPGADGTVAEDPEGPDEVDEA